MLRCVQNNGEKTYVRFGEIPENGRSFNYREDRYEEGVSVFAAYKIGNEYVVDITRNDLYNSDLELFR